MAKQQIEIHHYLHLSNDAKDQLNQIMERLNLMPTKEEFDTELQTLRDDVAEERQVITGAVTLITGLGSQLAAVQQELANAGVTAEQMAALTDLQASIESNKNTLAAAVTQNTPAAGQPPVTTPAPGTGQPSAVVITTDPATQEPLDQPVVVTQHPVTGDVLVTPVESGAIPNVVGDVVVDPSTGIPSVPEGSDTVLGDTTQAPDGHPDVNTLVTDPNTTTPIIATA